MQFRHAQPHPLARNDHERLNDPFIPHFPIIRLSPNTDPQLRLIRERDGHLPRQFITPTQNASAAANTP